ncbi:ANTAR domain-containing protein [Microlunatus flavus]|uniref:ANTAR domain-containing protein n=1 Tax=Microlunatus flavus TaxID=1036181 RepID=A0A1H9G5H8_9ACTN|nr:ANTAR domain-containing protein [Microlunatus flavus]SEQ45377.1 ANTAR domain-containing protein [Microlunatus flavus]
MDHHTCDPTSNEDPVSGVTGGPVARDVAGPARDGADRDVDSDVRADGHDLGSMRRALETQPAIEQAKGMLMAYYGIDADRAFAVLSRWSSMRHVKVRDLCRDIVEAAALPDASRFGTLERFLEQARGDTRGD